MGKKEKGKILPAMTVACQFGHFFCALYPSFPYQKNYGVYNCERVNFLVQPSMKFVCLQLQTPCFCIKRLLPRLSWLLPLSNTGNYCMLCQRQHCPAASSLSKRGVNPVFMYFWLLISCIDDWYIFITTRYRRSQHNSVENLNQLLCRWRQFLLEVYFPELL